MPTPNIDEYLETVHTALSNLQSDSELSTPLEAYGYTEAKIAALVDLYDEAAAAHLTQKTEYAQQYGATAAYETAREAAHTAYMRHLKLARIVYKTNVTRTHQLALQGERLKSYAGWKAQTDQFYTAALEEIPIQTDLATLGVTLASLQAAKTLVDAADAAWHAQKKEAGEAQEATEARDAALDALQEAFSDFVAIARIAFEEDAQKLERMGIPAPSGNSGGSAGEEEITPS